MLALVTKASNPSVLAGDSFTCTALLFLLDRDTPRLLYSIINHQELECHCNGCDGSFYPY